MSRGSQGCSHHRSHVGVSAGAHLARWLLGRADGSRVSQAQGTLYSHSTCVCAEHSAAAPSPAVSGASLVPLSEKTLLGGRE